MLVQVVTTITARSAVFRAKLSERYNNVHARSHSQAQYIMKLVADTTQSTSRQNGIKRKPLQGRLKEAQSRASGAKHASSGAATIFGLPAAEVHALLATPPRANRHVAGLDGLIASKHERHTHAWHVYVAQRDTAEQLLCEWVRKVSKQAVEALEGSMRALEEDMAVLDRSRLMLLDEATLLAVWLPDPAARW